MCCWTFSMYIFPLWCAISDFIQIWYTCVVWWGHDAYCFLLLLKGIHHLDLLVFSGPFLWPRWLKRHSKFIRVGCNPWLKNLKFNWPGIPWWLVLILNTVKWDKFNPNMSVHCIQCLYGSIETLWHQMILIVRLL